MAPPLTELVCDLSRPEAWPFRAGTVQSVQLVQTHLSVVFLTEGHVLKLKKPVDLGFVDFSTRQRRLLACEAECRLNERLAPTVYLGVAGVGRGPDGRWRVVPGPPGGDDEPAVLMRRLPADRTMSALLRAGEVDREIVERVARRIARFHDDADSGPAVQAASDWETLARVVRENLAQARRFEGHSLNPALGERLHEETERALLQCRELVQARAARRCGRDGHGDLRLDHVYVLGPDERDLLVVDCIEFRDDLRRGDPVGDVAFLVMELEFEGRADLASAFFGAWAQARGDREAGALLPLHLGYRHVVRAKVRSIESREGEIPQAAREEAAERAREHFVAALVALAPSSRRPALVLTCGLPGSGKSTVARGLEGLAGMQRVSSDETRHALAAGTADATRRAEHDRGLYSREWADRTYAACLLQCEEALLSGGRVVVDASFHDAARRRSFLELARRLRVPHLVLQCTCPEDEARMRLAARVGDASDADASVRGLLASRWEPPGAGERAAWRELPTGPTPDESIARALGILRDERLISMDVHDHGS